MHLTNNHRNAPGVWCMVDEQGTIVRHLGSETSARESGVRSLVASANMTRTLTAAATDEFMVPWESDAIAFLNTETSDGRMIDNLSGFRSFPIPLMAMFQTSWGHDGSYVVGRLDSGSVSGDNIPAKGFIDTLLPMGLQAARMVDTGSMDRVSIDPSAGTVEMEITEQDEDGWIIDWIDHYVDLEIGGLTLVNISAFAESKMRLAGPIPGIETTPQEDAGAEAAGLLASGLPAGVTSVTRGGVTITAAGHPVDPPVSMYQDPQFTGRTRMTILDPDENGHRRVYGHLAPWQECHIGIQGQCVMAPTSPSSYGWFTLGSLKCDDGCVIPIGSITFHGSHAEKHLSARAAAHHYDATCTAIADVTMGEDEFGVWYSGSLRTTATDEDVRELLAARLSGDWRDVNGELDLIAAHAVNTGGFPVYEEAIAADGSLQTVIASLDQPDESSPAPVRDEALRRAFAPLFQERVEALRTRVHG